MKWKDYVSVNPEICHGKACVKGTRVMVSVVLDNLAEGLSPEEIIRSYSALTHESVKSVLAYAAELAREQIVAIPA
ncbi:MAG: DUF433 domain-containing protein [Desulfococcaceae bacterium]